MDTHRHLIDSLARCLPLRQTGIIVMLCMMNILVAQDIQQLYQSKLLVPSGTTLTITTDSLYLDTLIMQSSSTLKFEQPTRLIVEHAWFDENCLLFAAGEPGLRGKHPWENVDYDPDAIHGKPGMDGHSLSLILVIESLGSLTINASGGKGGDGTDGKAGGNLENGQPGGNGGAGGHGGNIYIHYAAVGFVPVFNPKTKHKRSNSISVLNDGGAGGKAGRGGDAGRKDTSSTSGAGGTRVSQPATAPSRGNYGLTGISGKTGTLLIKKIE